MSFVSRAFSSSKRTGFRSRRLRAALLILLGAGLSGSIIASHVVGTRISGERIPILHAVEQTELRLSEGLLAFHRSGDGASPDQARRLETRLQEAELHLVALTFGGSCSSVFIPRMPREEGRAHAAGMLDGIIALRQGRDPRGLEGGLQELQEGARALRGRVEERLAAERETYGALQSAMAVLASLFLLLAAIEGATLARRLRASQRELRESRLRFAQVVAEMPILVVATGDDQRICFWNRECERVTGYAADEIVGIPDPLAKLYPDPEYRSRRFRDWAGAKGDFRNEEWEIACKDGTRRVIAWSDVSAQAPAAPWRYWTIGVDVTEQRRALADLKASEMRYAALVGHMNGAVAVYQAVDGGEDFVIREFNRAAERTEGIARSEVIGRRVREVFPGVEAFGIFAVFQRVWRTGEPERFPLACYEDDRLQGWRDNYIYRLPTGEVVAVYSDETERMRAEGQLRYHASLAASISDPVVSTDLEYRITSWNRAAEALYGWSAEEVVGKFVRETIAVEPTDGSPVATAKQECLRTGRWSGETRARKKDGSELFLDLSASVLLDERGRPCGVVTIHRDVTLYKRLLNALRESEARFRAITEHSRDITIILDRRLRLAYASPAVIAALGWDPAAVIGREALGFVHPGDREWVARILQETAENAGRVGYAPDFRARHREGGWVHLEGRVSSMLDVAGVDGLVATCWDATERLRTERILRRAQKTEAVGTLAGGVAHDFNNILYALLGYAQLAHDELPERHLARGHLEQVLYAGNRATDLVRRLLTFARQTEQSQRPLALGPLVEETLAMLRGTLPDGIGIASRIEPCGEVQGDPIQIQQLVMNLGTNGIRAMHDSGGVLEIRLEEVELSAREAWVGPDLRPGRYARLMIRDSGCGMDAQTLERVFEPYFSTREAGEGIGLGLAMVAGILRNHRGACRVETAPGDGTSFHAFLPLLSETASAPASPGEGGAAIAPLLLLVDPDEVARTAAAQAVLAAGCRVEAYPSYLQAITALERGPDRFALVLVGGSARASLREEMDDLLSRIAHGMPTILMEVEGLAGAGHPVAAAVRATLAKPVDPGRLAGCIADLIETGTEEQQWRAS